MLLECESEPVREKYIALFGDQLADLLERAHTEEGYSATQQWSAALPLASELEALSFEEAAGIAQGYLAELSRIGVNGQVVHDASLLPYSKSEITGALLHLLEASSYQESQSSSRSSVMVLAFSETDIGLTSGSIDQIGPQQKTWREVVEREMRNLVLP